MSKYITQAGKYRAFVQRPTTGGWLSQTDNGAEFVRIPLIIDLEDPSQGGCTIIWEGYISSDKAIARTSRMLLEALKAPANWFDLLAQGDGFLEGRAVLVTIEQRTKPNANGGRDLVYTKRGEPMYEATWLNDPDARPAGTPLDRSKMSALSRKLQAVAKSIQAETGAHTPAAAAPARPAAPQRTVYATDPINDLADDDLPF